MSGKNGKRPDPRERNLTIAYERNSRWCETLGHHWIMDPMLGDYSCGYCHAVRALYPEREIDQTIEPRGQSV